MSTVVAFILGGSPLVVPGDMLSQLICGIMTALLCCVPLLVLSRFRFLKSAASSTQTLVAVLICMVALLATMTVAMRGRIASLQDRLSDYRDSMPIDLDGAH